MFVRCSKNNENVGKSSSWNLHSDQKYEKNPSTELTVTFSKNLMHLTEEDLIDLFVVPQFSNVVLTCWANDWKSFMKQITDTNSVLPNANVNYDVLRDVYIYRKIWRVKNKYKN